MEKLCLELKKYYGENAEFREGQREAIESVLKKKRTLVVQKTGWGKSLVYFLATKILRKREYGITLIISPLLALMNNQIESANKLKLNVQTINSENTNDWNNIMDALSKNQVDALIISPERLANDEFKQWLIYKLSTKIQLFVVDEAHCISDWGHDFRPDYRRIRDIIRLLPPNVPVLATTATANNRVINDIKSQLGEDLVISHGSLARESLAIQVIKLASKEERLAWILKYINQIPGTGIIYCLTVNDCKLVYKWLSSNGILTESFYAGIEELENKSKEQIVENFMYNKIKVLVATVAFGMGFDKPDISFIIHFQKPGNIIAYYQQIGRAGRSINKAYAILLCGNEDNEINHYFIDSAFPTEDLMIEIVNTIIEHPGLKITDFEKYINMKASKIKACIKYLLVNGDIYKDRKLYYKTPRVWQPDIEKSKKITEIRKNELKQMDEFTNYTGCYMEYITKALDDTRAKKCGKCSNCLKHPLFPFEITYEEISNAQKYIKESFNIIAPRKKWPSGIRIDNKNTISEKYICEEGRVLSNYGDSGWGKLVSNGKYSQGYFDEQLVIASYHLLKDFVKENNIMWITNISSKKRPYLVKEFAEKLAKKLNLKYIDTIEKIQNSNCQKEMNTSYLQFHNANNSFEVSNKVLKHNVLLVDDMVDSRWTFTVCGYKLRKKGSGKIFPFALANSAGKDENT